MYYTRKQQEKFLDEELSAISEKYIQTIKTSAISLMEKEEVFVSQFLTIDGSGQMIVKVRNSRGLPRKGDYFCAVLFVGEMCLFKNWGNTSWLDLRRKYQKIFSEVVCTWHSNSENPDFSLVGFKGLSIEMSSELKKGCIITLGPQEPPTAYYENLISIVRNENENTECAKILDFDLAGSIWDPTKIDKSYDSSQFILGQLALADHIIIQGPPGTGKTHKMADLASRLLYDGKSVLVTALTNRALMELASKDSLRPFLANKVVHKTRLTADEQKEIPLLQNIKSSEILCSPGNLTLATFYISSGWASAVVDEEPFDLVIMDEASQAFFAMIGASKKLGKKVIWIGDQCQLPPVVIMSSDIIIKKDYERLIDGFGTLCDNFNYPSFLFTDTYRLSKRAAEYTGLFYNKVLNSVADTIRIPNLPFLHCAGGPVLIEIPMPIGNKVPDTGIEMVMTLVGRLIEEKSLDSLAVLTKFRATVKSLQKAYTSRFGTKGNVLIDTVERVQGLTCDVCIFIIPNAMTSMSFNRSLFNVATSRARQNTIIIAPDNYIGNNIPTEVSLYMQKLKKEDIFVAADDIDDAMYIEIK